MQIIFQSWIDCNAKKQLHYLSPEESRYNTRLTRQMKHWLSRFRGSHFAHSETSSLYKTTARLTLLLTMPPCGTPASLESSIQMRWKTARWPLTRRQTLAGIHAALAHAQLLNEGLGPGDLQGSVSSGSSSAAYQGMTKMQSLAISKRAVSHRTEARHLGWLCPLHCRLKRLTKTSNPAPCIQGTRPGGQKPMKLEAALYKGPSWIVPKSHRNSGLCRDLLQQFLNRIQFLDKWTIRLSSHWWLNFYHSTPSPSWESCG